VSLLQQAAGTYKTKEQIQKAPTDDHPCNLTRTSVKISFPALKSETFVNLLGYKEPNLIYLWRCRGVCSSSSRPVACVATKTSQKTVTMAFRTHLTKQDSKELRVGKERVKEVVLEEDVECGCHCAGISPNHCKGHFDEHLCECQCLGQAMEEAQLACEADQQGSFWDKRSCSCKSKSISPRGVNRPLSNPGCLEGDERGHYGSTVFEAREVSPLNIISYVILGCCLTAAVFLALTTIHYRKKLRRLLKAAEVGERPQEVKELGRRSSRRATWVSQGAEEELLQAGGSQAVPAGARRSVQINLDQVEEIYIEEGGSREMYEDQYDSHGVLVTRDGEHEEDFDEAR